jgi:hypothetical protein
VKRKVVLFLAFALVASGCVVAWIWATHQTVDRFTGDDGRSYEVVSTRTVELLAIGEWGLGSEGGFSAGGRYLWSEVSGTKLGFIVVLNHKRGRLASVP